MKRLVLLLSAVTLLLAGCSSGSSEADEHNDADVAFAQQMIPHHEQAVEMSELALDDSRGASAEVQALATQIEKAQQPEIDTMNGWLEDWGVDEKDSGHEGHDMSGMTGMMTEGDMDLLADSTGADFDRLWLTMMVEHHEGAVDMARTVLDDGSDPDVAALADDVVTTQKAEIADMKGLLDE